MKRKMKISRLDFRDYVVREQIISARQTEIVAVIHVMTGKVEYEVNTRLEVPFWTENVSEEASKYSYYHNSFDSLEDAILAFNVIQQLEEDGELIRIVGV